LIIAAAFVKVCRTAVLWLAGKRGALFM